MVGDWLRKQWSLVLMLAGSVAVPYLVTRTGSNNQESPRADKPLSSSGVSRAPNAASSGSGATLWARPTTAQEQPSTGNTATQSAFASPETTNIDGTALPYAAASTPTQPIVRLDFSEILRFDIRPEWIVSRWDRVSTQITDGQLQGMRVTVITGTQQDDVAGVLTYYFDAHHKLQRITLIGQSGDYRRLAFFVQAQFRLEPRPSREAGLWLAGWNGRPTSVLLVRHSPVVAQSAPYARYEIWLELNLPRNGYRLSSATEDVLRAVVPDVIR